MLNPSEGIGSFLTACVLCSVALSAPVAAATVSDQATDLKAVEELVNKFTEAQVQKDAATLRSLTADQYVEISPLGEVDPREKMLGFYVKTAASGTPTLAIDDRTVALSGGTAVMTAKLQYTMNKDGQSRSFDMRVSYVAHKEGGQWKLLSSQGTPIRPRS